MTRRMRLTAPLGFVLVCLLLAGLLPAAASATAPEMRGEWSLVVKSGPNTIEGTGIISQEADGEGKFAAHNVVFANVIPGTFTGTLEGATATVKTTTQAFGPVGEGEFNSKTMAVESGVGTLKLSGEGEFGFVGSPPSTATLDATRIRTYKQIEEQEAQEKKEQEEREARANVRGEWAVTLESGPITLKGIALISEVANAKNEFASSSALFEGFIPGTFAGTLEGAKATVKVTTEAAGPAPAGEFTSNEIVVVSPSNPASMSGPGTFSVGGSKTSGTLTATRLRTHRQIEEQEKSERETKEKQEKEAQEAKEKAERESREKAELEAKKKREQEEAAKAVKPLPVVPPILTPPLLSIELTAKTATTTGHSGALSLSLANPNTMAVHGHLKLTLAKAGKASATHAGSSTLAEASFTIAGHGKAVVKLKLSKSGRSQLTRHKTLRVVVALVTQATGEPDASKTYTITLRVATTSTHHGKG